MVINAELWHAGPLDPLGKEVAHIAAGDLRRDALEIINPGVFVPKLIEKLAQHLIELFPAERLAQHAKDHRALVKDDRLIGGRLIVQRCGRAHDRRCLLKSQRALLLFALRRIEQCSGQRGFPQSERAPFRQAL